MNKTRYKITYEDDIGFEYTVWRSYETKFDAYDAFKSSGYKVLKIDEVL